MEFLNLLADIPISLFGDPQNISLNWIGKFVQIIISSGVGVGFGIILFSLILKVVVLPFDIFQRIAMRKQNIKMRENKDKMEKLQKQYANDKQMYNQKLMEMQRQSGMSLLSSCLPMILSLVIFIMAIGAFNAYAKYSTVQNYNSLVDAYKTAVNEYVVDVDAEDTSYTLTKEGETHLIIVEEADKLIYFRAPISAETAATLATADQATLKAEAQKVSFDKRQHLINVEKAKTNTEIAATIDFESADYTDKLLDFFHTKGATGAKETYESEVASSTKFLWIKNVWTTDASYKHPVLSHEDFLKELASSSCGSSCSSNGKFDINGEELTLNSDGALVKDNVLITNVYEENVYNKVTAGLEKQKDQANGYYILIVLSIGTILLQQFITMHSQKEQQKYSSVDGQAASTQKMTMIVMTIMFGVFSFMYSSAFSIYMITSNVFSLVSTLIINKCVDVAEHKKEAKALQEKYSRRMPRTVQNNKTGKGKNKKGK